MYCPKCGEQVIYDADFCSKCGFKVIKETGIFDKQLTSTPADNVLLEHNDFLMDNKNTQTLLKSEAVVSSYSNAYIINSKIKVFCNGQLLGLLGRNESISIPIQNDSILDFKCFFRKAKIAVKKGEYRELKLEFNRGTGKLYVFDLNSKDSTESYQKITKTNKKWLAFSAIFITLFIVLRLISFLISGSSEAIDYIETVKQMKPYENYEITATYDTVINKYISSPIWEKREASDKLIYVDIIGKIIDTDGSALDIAITFKLTAYEGNSDDYQWIEPYSFEMDNQAYNSTIAEEFIRELFEAYDQGYESMDEYYSSDITYSDDLNLANNITEEFPSMSLSNNDISDNVIIEDERRVDSFNLTETECSDIIYLTG
ncbi:MAG: zinc ribbon domain-containing protein [Eubacterium sp.]|jgi:hypothetical protein|nr:zinc ribbon domain-containing protein [Eubacterium sp.]